MEPLTQTADDDLVAVKIPVTADAIKHCHYTSQTSCAIAEGTNSLLKPGIRAFVGYKSIGLYNDLDTAVEIDIPNGMGFKDYQDEHPKGFYIPVMIPRACLKEEVLALQAHRGETD